MILFPLILLLMSAFMAWIVVDMIRSMNKRTRNK